MQPCPLSATVKTGGPRPPPRLLSPCPPWVPCCDRGHGVGRGTMGIIVLHGSCQGLCFPHSDPRLRSHSWKPRAHIQSRASECPMRLPHVAYPQDKCVGLRSAFLFRCVIFSHVMSTLNTRARAPGSSAGSESGGSRFEAAFPFTGTPTQAWLIILLCRWDPRDPNTQAGSPATQQAGCLCCQGAWP